VIFLLDALIERSVVEAISFAEVNLNWFAASGNGSALCSALHEHRTEVADSELADLPLPAQRIERLGDRGGSISKSGRCR